MQANMKNTNLNLASQGSNTVYQLNNPSNVTYTNYIGQTFGATSYLATNGINFANFPNISAGNQAGLYVLGLYQLNSSTTVQLAQGKWNQSDLNSATSTQIANSWAAAGFNANTPFSSLDANQLLAFFAANATSAEGFHPDQCAGPLNNGGGDGNK